VSDLVHAPVRSIAGKMMQRHNAAVMALR